MALIDCPECRREVSSSAVSCPDCGYPVATGTPPVPIRAVARPSGPPWWRVAIPLLARIMLGGMLAAIGGGEEESAAAVIGGLIIAGSAVPAWYRAKIDRLRDATGGRALDELFENRMLDLEQRYQDHIVQLERVHSGQLAELEERIDFAERLLTRQQGHDAAG